jgi:hypothetical protein
METSEHRQAGNKIRIKETNNPYLSGGMGLEAKKPLEVTMMGLDDGVAKPLTLKLTSGDIVSLAGDYYTYSGWGNKLVISERSDDDPSQVDTIVNTPVTDSERDAFVNAYSALASKKITKKDTDAIFERDEKVYIPFSSTLNSYFKQALFYFTIPNYGKSLENNEAHFVPWSTRAYIVGHTVALEKASIAYHLSQKAKDDDYVPNEKNDEYDALIKKINETPSALGLDEKMPEKERYEEMANRYQSLAYGMELDVLHYYSDHFAAGHSQRLGQLRKTLPEKFGKWGSILVNDMHNEDNQGHLLATNPIQNKDRKDDAVGFIFPRETNPEGGDGTYDASFDFENRQHLRYGMTQSMTDITQTFETGKAPEHAKDFGGFNVLPIIDFKKPQPQPMFIQGKDGQVYYRKDISKIETLSPEAYQKTLNDPAQNGYETLTKWRAFKLVVKLRVLSFIYKPQFAEDKNEKKDTPPIKGSNALVALGKAPRPKAQKEKVMTDEAQYKEEVKREKSKSSVIVPPKEPSMPPSDSSLSMSW